MIALRLVAQAQLDAARQPAGPQQKAAAGQGEIA
jgi:hypothetical protein